MTPEKSCIRNPVPGWILAVVVFASGIVIGEAAALIASKLHLS